MPSRYISRPGFLVWLGCLLTTLLVSLLLNPGAEPQVRNATSTSDVETLHSRIKWLESQSAQIEGRVRGLEASASIVPIGDPAPRRSAELGDTRSDTVVLAALESQVGQLKAPQGTRQQHAAQPEDTGQSPGNQMTEVARRQVAQALIVKRNVSDRVKADAWHDLAGMKEYPWTDDIIIAVTQIGLSSSDDRAREIIWIGAANANHRSERLVQPLIAALSDPVASVREKAADALGKYMDVSGVPNALRWTSVNDSSEEVRREASRVLAEWK